MTHFRDIIKQKRIDLGFEQRDLARKIGISLDALKSLEADAHGLIPDRDVVGKLAFVLGLNKDFLCKKASMIKPLNDESMSLTPLTDLEYARGFITLLREKNLSWKETVTALHRGLNGGKKGFGPF